MVESVRIDSGSYNSNQDVSGFYVFKESNSMNLDIPHLDRLIPLGDEEFYIADPEGEQLSDSFNINMDLESIALSGDVVSLDSRAEKIRVILSEKANSNTLLLTEKCNNFCSFCSQPPKDWDDRYLYQAAAIATLNFNSTEYVGLTGGEPTIHKEEFLNYLKTLNDFKNTTKLHILTNGRTFSDPEFSKKVVDLIGDREVLWGIPIYGHNSEVHDELVSAKGAFNETCQGLLNLLGSGQNIELRIVPSAKNFRTLVNIIDFLVSNFRHIGVISIMNMEPIGFARKNYHSLYVPVGSQSKYLTKAVAQCNLHGQPVRLFNYPLCLLDKELRDISIQSISDWKNYFPEDCEQCSLKSKCCGFFTSAKGRYIENVEAFHERED